MKLNNFLYRYINLGAFLLALLLLLSSFLCIGENFIPIRNATYTDFSKNWTLVDGINTETISLPISKDTNNNKIIVLEKVLPLTEKSDGYYGDSLVFFSNQAKVQVFIADKIVYSYGYAEEKVPGGSFYDLFNQVVIGKVSGGEKITIKLEYPRNAQFELEQVRIVPTNGIKDYFLSLQFFDIVLCIAFLILAILIYFMFGLNKSLINKNKLNSFFILAEIALFCSLWCLSSSQILQFFTFGLRISNYLNYFIFFLLPIPLMDYYVGNVSERIKTQNFINVGLMLFFLIIMIIHFSFDVPIGLFVPLYIFIYFSMFVYLLILLYQEYKRKTDNISFINFIILLIFFIGGVASYFLSFKFQDIEVLSIMRFVFFVYLLALYKFQILLIKKDMEIGIEANIYKHLAYTDKLTEINNRDAFYEALDNICKQQISVETCNMVFFNIHDMKKINNRNGREEGDKVLLVFVDKLIKAFEGSDNVFRFGGDEFVVIMVGRTNEEYQYMFNNFNREIELYNLKGEKSEKLQYTFGQARTLSVLTYEKLKKLMLEARYNMYKQRIKNLEANSEK